MFELALVSFLYSVIIFILAYRLRRLTEKLEYQFSRDRAVWSKITLLHEERKITLDTYLQLIRTKLKFRDTQAPPVPPRSFGGEAQ